MIMALLIVGFVTLAVVASIIVLVVALVGQAGVSQAGVSRADRKAPVLTAHATVVGQRTEVVPVGDASRTKYYATFELETGERLEFAITGPTAGQLVTGDAGALTWQGSKMQDFQRELLR